ncbi:MAG: DUF928 domain-containing protein [Nitrospira sp.]|nr:DUF928 domain-containing protein [Nitrospira sp.]MBH0186804.1 DUF928 domain-containing protein [Nitrospira sp.]
MRLFISISLAAGVALLFPWVSWAEEKHKGESQPTVSQSGVESSAKPLLYIPPRKGAPAPGFRRGGGTRGMNKSVPVISVLAPDHVGLTLHAQPVLYWFASTEQTLPYEFVLIADNAEVPSVVTRLPQPARPGIQQIRLSDVHVTLSLGERYHWSVALIVDSDEPSGNIVAKGVIERVDRDKLEQPLPNDMAMAEMPSHYAAAGVWYDAIAAFAELIQSHPADGELLRQRAALLEQGGLGEVAVRMGAVQASSAQ